LQRLITDLKESLRNEKSREAPLEKLLQALIKSLSQNPAGGCQRPGDFKQPTSSGTCSKSE